MPSDLFLVKHLLIFREQLSPFDIELRSVERQLDFSEAGEAVARFLANRNRRLFSMSTENALVPYCVKVFRYKRRRSTPSAIRKML